MLHEYILRSLQNTNVLAIEIHTTKLQMASSLYISVIKQELRSWFEVNANFPSTAPTANMIHSVGLLSQSHLDLSGPTM